MIYNDNVVFKSATSRGNSPGYKVKYLARKGSALRIIVKTGVQMGLQEFPVETNRWMHVAFTWHSSDYLHSFINGCPAPNTRMYNVSDSYKRYNFTIGGERSAAMKIDDFRVWYKTLNAQQIWHAYTL